MAASNRLRQPQRNSDRFTRCSTTYYSLHRYDELRWSCFLRFGMLYLKGIIGSPHNFIASRLTLRNLPNVAPIMVREAKVDKPETVMLYLKGNIEFHIQQHSVHCPVRIARNVRPT